LPAGWRFTNCAARYLYALGRENLFPFAGRTLGRSHSRHGSPMFSTVQTVIATLIVLLFFITGKDPYADIYTCWRCWVRWAL
jgi:amino acid transporter